MTCTAWQKNVDAAQHLVLDVVVDTYTADAPFGKDIRLGRQGVEHRPVEFFEQLPAGASEPADRPLLVEPPEQLADRRVELGEAVEPSIAQPRQNPPLDNSTQASTLALSRGRRGRVGSTAVP